MANSLGTAKGPYATMSYTSGMRNGPSYGAATMYYPTGDAKPPFGCVTVVPGFTALQSSIRAWGPFLASHGIITMTIDTNTTSDPPQTRASALMDALMTCVAENTRMGSPIMGKVATDHLGVAGWSMGGGGTLIAAAANPTLKAATSFAAWGPTGGAMNKVPVLMFEATADPLAASMSDSYYSSTPDSVPKMLFEVNGAGHDVANSPANSQGIIGLYGLSWWKVFMEGDMRYKQFLTAAKPSITTSKFKTNVK
jgi:dienelactone hydrolase